MCYVVTLSYTPEEHQWCMKTDKQRKNLTSKIFNKYLLREDQQMVRKGTEQ